MNLEIKQPKIGVSGILYLDNKYLLGKRDINDTQGGKWVTAGGGVEFGETLDQALIREYFEETGLNITISNNFLSIQERISIRHVVMVFKEVQCKDLSKLISGDGFSEVSWFTKEDIEDLKNKDEITNMTYLGIMDFILNR
jgi:8-oxo-dGTP diphosphatase